MAVAPSTLPTSPEAHRGDAEVLVVGGGHNGLICAAYLARQGFDTLLLEAREHVGGCASTESALGARFNICNCDHSLVRALPIVDELELADHGLTYLEPEAGSLNLYYDGSPPWLFFHDVDRTLQSIAATFPNQEANYRRYLEDAIPVAELVLEMIRSRATLASLARTAVGRRSTALATLLRWGRMSALDVLQNYFDDWRLLMPAITTGPTVWGVPPETPRTGVAAVGYATRHLVRTGRPVGGSGALTDAVAKSFEAAGGRIRRGARVERLLVDGESISGVALANGEQLTAPTVVTACDPHRVLVDWLGEAPGAARRTQQRYRSQPSYEGYESKVDAIVESVPAIAGTENLNALFPEVNLNEPTAVVSPTLDGLAEAHRRRKQGLVADEPSLLMNLPSVLDPAMQTADGRHVYSLEVLFTPYSLPGGWPDSGEPKRWLDVANRFWEPGLHPRDGEWRAMTPDLYESQFNMTRGHAPSYVASPLATLLGRAREVSRYRGPVAGLYLTGAGTWPGAGVSGAPGRNAAQAVIDDAEQGRWAGRRGLQSRFGLVNRLGRSR